MKIKFIEHTQKPTSVGLIYREMSGPGNREVHPGVIYDWNTMVKWFVEKVCFESRVKETRGDSGDADENGDLAW